MWPGETGCLLTLLIKNNDGHMIHSLGDFCSVLHTLQIKAVLTPAVLHTLQIKAVLTPARSSSVLHTLQIKAV